VRDLLVITPSRGRPDSMRRLAQAIAATAQAETDLIFAVDDDDPASVGAAEAAGDGDRVRSVHGPRQSLIEWTNVIAVAQAPGYRALASFGDDHVPRTEGWDVKLLAVLDDKGPGIAYPDDCNPRNYTTGPMVTAPVMSSQIVTALGWMCYPPLIHFYADNVWEDLGRDAECLYWVPEIVVEHLHYTVTGTAPDATYGEAYRSWDSDQQAFYAWREGQRVTDGATVRRVHDGAV
jgi:hypothetical protein